MIYNFGSLTFQILSVNRFFHKEGFFSVKARPYAALSLRISGTGSFSVGDQAFTSSPGDLLFMPDGVDYLVTYTGGESIVIHLTDCTYKQAESIKIKNRSSVLKDFLTLYEGRKSLNDINGKKAVIYSMLQSVADFEREEPSDPAFKLAVDYISQSFTESDLTLDSVCRASGLSVSSLRRKFQAYYGTSPQKYITSLRLSRAVGILVKPNSSVREAAAKSGFADEKYFSRIIKKHYGVSPSSLKSS